MSEHNSRVIPEGVARGTPIAKRNFAMTTRKWMQFIDEVKREWRVTEHDLAAARNDRELAERLREVTALPLHRIQREIQQMLHEFERKVRCATDTQKSAAA